MKWSIGSKVLSIFAIATVMALIISIIAFRGATETIESGTSLQRSYEIGRAFQFALSDIKDAETGQRGFLITGETRYLDPYESGRTRLEESLSKLKLLAAGRPQQEQRVEALAPLARKKMAELAESIRLRKESGFEAARKSVLTDQGREVMDQIRSLVEAGKNESQAQITQRDAENKEDAAKIKWILIVGAILNVLVFGLMAIFVRRSIIEPLARVVRVAQGVAEGDLRQEKLPDTSTDEVGDLSRVFNVMVLSLRDLSAQNIAAAKGLGAAAAQVLSSIQEQASATRQQATSIQETTTTMEEIAQSGAQVAERARQVAAAAEITSTASNQGIMAVQGTNLTMQGVRTQIESVAQNIVNLSERNQTIGEIIASVNDIAEQSNLLALNAAIEAAAAGDYGRRFSVVAGEIKNLAEQAKGATVQVRSILGDIQKGINSSVMLTEEAVKRSESGKQQAELAEQTIQQLSGTTQESVRAFQQIVGATNQQQIGFDQITQALKAIRIGAEQTASSTTQLEKAALSLNTLGQQLQKTVEKYRL
jgi:methyl-accepting chemotaxis protein